MIRAAIHRRVYRVHGLLSLLRYARAHRHSEQWIAPIHRLIEREVSRG
jgi:hypothetical protein